MKFNIYGRFQLDVRRENDSWAVYRLDDGRRARIHDVLIPPTFAAEEIATYLDDVFHELSGPGERVEPL